MLEDLNVLLQTMEEWNYFILSLAQPRISFVDRDGVLVWEPNGITCEFTVKLAYEVLVDKRRKLDIKWWYKSLWKINMTLKVNCFSWLLL